MRHSRPLLPVVLLISLTACGSGSGPSSRGSITAGVSGDHQVATIKGTDSLVFSPAEVKAKPGKLELTLDVTGGVPHNLEVKGVQGAVIDNVPGHEKRSVSFTVSPGSYQLICTYHPGMRGTLVVAP